MHKKRINFKLKITNTYNSIKSKLCIFFKNIICFFREKGKKEKIKKLLKKCSNFLTNKKVLGIIIMSIPFVLMDLITRILASSLEYFALLRLTPRLFSLAYIFLFIGITFNLSKKQSFIVYVLLFSVFYILFIVNNVYYSITNNFFSFSLLGLASEGSTYFMDAIKSCNGLVYVWALIILLIFIYSLRFLPKNHKNNGKMIFNVILIFLLSHLISKMFLGPENFELTWDTWRNPRNVYNNFNDNNKCMAIAGFYEYNLRDFYINYMKPKEKKTVTESNFLEEVFNSSNDSFSKNKYTGIFKDKNVIFLQFEGIDDWLFNKETMPNTYALLNNSINFTKHYSFYNGGGSTFNSEFAVNVGYMTPFTYPINAYTLNKNDFPYSMANLMKSKDYSLKTFHMNSSEYYSRGINYSNWGYDRYFGLKDLGIYKNTEYYLDRELILNETFYNEMFKSEGKFVNYIITYSNHMPFTSEKGVCNQLLKLDYANEFETLNEDKIDEYIKNLNLSEEDCIRRQAKETDYFVKLLLESLKENNLYDDTIIVAFTDHYLYTVSDQSILEKYKETSNNLINKTPFFIWSNGMKPVTVTKVTSQLNILPTFLNLMGVNYNEKWYVSSDALNNKYQSLSIFSDLSWYDGNIYVTDGIVKNSKKTNNDSLEKKNSLVEYLIKKNDLVLKYNYFKEIMN